uniref:Ig-like domain-containing protein n=1 Tax=Naja naja TaxID=35670 RepID=A0A8C6V7M0_NAJNA
RRKKRLWSQSIVAFLNISVFLLNLRFGALEVRQEGSFGECHFLNGTQQVRLLLRSFYNRQEIDYFDSDLGKYVAVTPLGQPDVDKWNRDEVYLQYWKAQVDSVCRHNYRLYSYKAVESLLVQFPSIPTVTISPTKMDPASPNTILLCTARGFYPLEIEVRWLKNGQLEEEGVAFGEELQNGDWTYQLQVILETQPQWGDVYTCQVEHASLEAPITVQWGKPLPSCPEKGERRFLCFFFSWKEEENWQPGPSPA